MGHVSDKDGFSSFKEFYPYYLQEHKNKVCRRLHVLGSTLVLTVLVAALISGHYIWLWSMPLIGYGFAWVGHFFFEKNKPATFTYPFYSFLGDWVMFKDIITRKVPW
ncbi:DUF962 domain-containing protein [Pseudoalteromonas sp. T1lg48]|uniref:DUF962 domain-containing protein n=1 Tax=Pseudoalteromonas sp. T1lg48 TaxID=2077100 RepID=UPI000CF677D8|nr:DUF962 domain-containing protein [Pseudoalteromonas sp. T1lg48]